MNYKKIRFNRLVITPLYLLVKLGSDRTPVDIFYNKQKAYEYTHNEILPHYLHILFSDDHLQSVIGEELMEKLNRFDKVDSLIHRIDLISDMWDEAMEHASTRWDFASKGFFKSYVLKKGMGMSDEGVMLWENERNGLITNN